MEKMNYQPEERFFLSNFDVDRAFRTIRRTDYQVLYYIKMLQQQTPEEKVYLADLAQAMEVRMPELSKRMEALQDSGFVSWGTDREAGRTYVALTTKAVERMAEEHAFLKRCYDRLRAEIGDEELLRTAAAMQRVTGILRDEREKNP